MFATMIRPCVNGGMRCRPYDERMATSAQPQHPTATDESAESQGVKATPPPVRSMAFWKPIILFTVMETVIVSLILVIFAWPLVNATPAGLPIGIVGPAVVTDAVEQAVDSQAPGVFSWTEFDSADTAVAAIGQREIYGAFVLSDTGLEVITASAANVAVSQLLSQVGQQISDATARSYGLTVLSPSVIDVAPMPATDARGAGLSAAALPLVIAGIVAALLATVRMRFYRQRAIFVAKVSFVAGAAIAGILQGLGILVGNWWLEWLAISVGIAAVGFVLVGLQALFKFPGIIVGILLFFIIGNPISATALPVEFYPAPLGFIGQLLPLGSEISLLRRISFFPDAPQFIQWITLVGWTALGIILMLIGVTLQNKRSRAHT